MRNGSDEDENNHRLKIETILSMDTIQGLYQNTYAAWVHVCGLGHKRSRVTRVSIIANYNRSMIENLAAERARQIDGCSLSVDEMARDTFGNIFTSVYKRRIRAGRAQFANEFIDRLARRDFIVIRITEVREHVYP